LGRCRAVGHGYNVRMHHSSKSVAESFVRAINRHDIEDLAAHMTAGHRFVDSLGNVVAGRDKMRAGWAGYFRMVPDYSIAVEECFCEGPVVVLLGVAQGTYAPDGVLRPVSRWTTGVALRAQIEDGLISEWRVYADNEPLRERMRESG
jgi:ketosteroid isomerase-like protein